VPEYIASSDCSREVSFALAATGSTDERGDDDSCGQARGDAVGDLKGVVPLGLRGWNVGQLNLYRMLTYQG